jgi:hypothetical protein
MHFDIAWIRAYPSYASSLEFWQLASNANYINESWVSSNLPCLLSSVPAYHFRHNMSVNNQTGSTSGPSTTAPDTTSQPKPVEQLGSLEEDDEFEVSCLSEAHFRLNYHTKAYHFHRNFL